jgi:hypothetical protein
MPASSRHSQGAHLLSADGSVKFVETSVDAEVWRGIGTVSGAEVSSEF